MSGQRRPPGRGMWFRAISTWQAPQCTEAARWIADMPRPLVRDIPAELLLQVSELAVNRLVTIEPDGYITRARGVGSSLERRNDDSTTG